MSEDILNCKHGLYKETCIYCRELSDESVITEKQEALQKRNWQSSSFFDNSAHNSASGEQEYDIEEDFVEYDNESDLG